MALIAIFSQSGQSNLLPQQAMDLEPHVSGRKPIGRPANADSAVTRESIIDAAIHQMAALGFERMTLDDVAEEAGITRTAIYRYYGSKMELARAAFERSSSETYALPDRYAVLASEARNVNERLRAFVLVCMQMSIAEPEKSVGYFQLGQVATQDPEVARIFSQRSRYIRDFAITIVDDAVRAGELPQDTDQYRVIEGVSGLIWAMVHGLSAAPNERVRAQLMLAADALLMSPEWLPVADGQ